MAAGIGCGLCIEESDKDPAGGPVDCHKEVAAPVLTCRFVQDRGNSFLSGCQRGLQAVRSVAVVPDAITLSPLPDGLFCGAVVLCQNPGGLPMPFTRGLPEWPPAPLVSSLPGYKV